MVGYHPPDSRVSTMSPGIARGMMAKSDEFDPLRLIFNFGVYREIDARIFLF